MTVTAPKGARRAAHAARTAKHAQRTELPARAVADEHDAALAASVAPKRQSRKTQPKVPASTADAVAANLDPFTTPVASDSRSLVKAKAVVDALKPHGWSTSVGGVAGHERAEDVVELTARRGTEVLWISWTAGKMTLEPMPTYTVEDRTIKLKNASAVKIYGARPPETGQRELEKVRTNRFFRRRPTEPRRSRLPFDPNLATDEEVIAALQGKVVSWHNDRTQGTEVAYFNDRGKSARFMRVEERDNDRIVHFVCPQTGFRAFYLSKLVKVGGNPRAFKARRNGDDD